MDISIRSHKAALAEDFREITKEKLLSMERFNVPIQRIVVEVLHENNPKQGKKSHRVNLTSHGAGPFIRAEGIGHNDLAAFDEAISGFELQIRKVHERYKEISRETLRRKDAI
jgi:ribosomal subunit interface protein